MVINNILDDMDVLNVDTYAYFGIFKEGFGCFMCNDLFALVSSSSKRCIQKQYDQKSYFHTENISIPNCLSYFYDDQNSTILKCSVCKNGYIIFDDNLSCGEEIVNCKIGNNQSLKTCLECEDLFYLNSAETHCISYAVDDCKSYDTNISIPVCVDCNQGYRITSDKM